MKKLILIPLFLVFMLSVAYAAVTSVTPTTGGTVTSTYNFTATSTLAGGAVNCTWATTTDGIFAVTFNTSTNTAMYNYSNTALLTEVEDTTLTITCYNSTWDHQNGSESTTLLINVDNTNPVCSCSTSRLIYDTFEEIDYDCSASSDTTDMSYSCAMTYSDASSETETSQIGVFSNTDVLGESSLVCTITDEASKTNACSTITLTIESQDDPTDPDLPGDDDQINKAPLVITLVLIVAVVGIAIALSMTGKGKKRRR